MAAGPFINDATMLPELLNIGEKTSIATEKGSGVFFRIGRRPGRACRTAVGPIRKKTPDPFAPRFPLDKRSPL